jgi:hypothetical protein
VETSLGKARRADLEGSFPQEPIEDALLLWSRLREPKMPADGSLHLFFGDIAALRHQLISNHDGRGKGQPQFGVFFRAVFLVRLGCGLDFNVVLSPQPGDHFGKMPSRLTAGIVYKDSQFQHVFFSI